MPLSLYLSPSCFSPRTRYRQTVFYTPDTLTVSMGDKITGQLSCAPNARNNRDLDIAVSYQAPGEEAVEIQYKMCVPPSFLPSSLWGAGPDVR